MQGVGAIVPGVIDRLTRIAVANQGLVTRQQALTAGVRDHHLAHLVRRGLLARVARGVYAVGEPIPDARALAAAWRAVISYDSAAAWLGFDLPEPVDLLHLSVARSRGRYAERVPGTRLHRADIAPGDIVMVRGARVTCPLRTAMDVSRHAPVDHSVALVDAMLRAGAFTVDEYLGVARRAKGPGRLRIQVVASLVDPDSGSVLESLTRTLLWRHGLAPERTQFSVRGQGGWIGRVDFAWPEQRLIVECDGYEFHAARDPFQKDRRRWSALTAASWRVLVVTWFDVTRDPSYVVDLVRGALAPAAIQHANVLRVAS